MIVRYVSRLGKKKYRSLVDIHSDFAKPEGRVPESRDGDEHEKWSKDDVFPAKVVLEYGIHGDDSVDGVENGGSSERDKNLPRRHDVSGAYLDSGGCQCFFGFASRNDGCGDKYRSVENNSGQGHDCPGADESCSPE